MSGLLFIGSTCADVVVRVPKLPVTGEDLHVISQRTALGGCACNAFLAARLVGRAECTLFSPVGTGVWGDWVDKALRERGVAVSVPRVSAPNGCCYCMVEDGGERTFLSHHGAEYLFEPHWFDTVDLTRYDGVYLCGIEVEESTGGVILAALEAEPPKRLYFTPGPRICRIAPEKLARVMALHPVLHMNAPEAAQYTGAESVEQAAAMLHGVTGGDVIITLGAEGAYVHGAEGCGVIPGVKATVVDTIGAGDAHIGAVMAARADGKTLFEAVCLANRVSAAVVSAEGAELTQAMWNRMGDGQA